MTEIGVNLPWFGGAYGHDLGRNMAYPDWPVWYDPAKVDDLLELLRSFGIRLVRIWLFEEGEGIGGDDLFLRNLRDLVERFKAAGIRIYWTLLDANAARGKRDRITARILMDADAARQFCSEALAVVAPVISEVAWGVDLCNEPEAVCGRRWRKVEPSLSALREGVSELMPGVKLSIGSAQLKYPERLNLDLDFYDFHIYAPVSEALVCPPRLALSPLKPAVLGEIGCVIPEADRGSEQAWRQSQACLAESIGRLSGLGYEAVFLWYLNDPAAADAMSLVYRNEVGPAMRRVGPLARGWPPGQPV
jgi:hypothetical protein